MTSTSNCCVRWCCGVWQRDYYRQSRRADMAIVLKGMLGALLQKAHDRRICMRGSFTAQPAISGESCTSWLRSSCAANGSALILRIIFCAAARYRSILWRGGWRASLLHHALASSSVAGTGWGPSKFADARQQDLNVQRNRLRRAWCVSFGAAGWKGARHRGVRMPIWVV